MLMGEKKAHPFPNGYVFIARQHASLFVPQISWGRQSFLEGSLSLFPPLLDKKHPGCFSSSYEAIAKFCSQSH